MTNTKCYKVLNRPVIRKKNEEEVKERNGEREITTVLVSNTDFGYIKNVTKFLNLPVLRNKTQKK